MHATTDTTIALPTRRDPGHLRRPATVESDRRPASCTPARRWKTASGQHRTCPPSPYGDRSNRSAEPITEPRLRTAATNDRREPQDRIRTEHDQNDSAATCRNGKADRPPTRVLAENTAAPDPTRSDPANAERDPGGTEAGKTPAAAEGAGAREATGTSESTGRWSPGSNRCRTPITAGPSSLTEDRSTTENPNLRCSPESEWSPGKMQGVRKPGWGARFSAKLRGESGMSTAEYAVGTLAAVAFAGVLLKVLTSGTVQGALSSLIERALS